jgi:hypothetical protein
MHETEQVEAKAAAVAHVQEVLRSAQYELTGLLRQREDLMKRIGTARQVIASMSDLFGESVLSDELRLLLHGPLPKGGAGFTVACRQVLMRSQAPLSLRRFCEQLRRSFPEMAGRHKDLTASAGTVLRRLAAYGEASYHPDEKGNRLWEWIARAEEEAPKESDRGLNRAALVANYETKPPMAG